MRYKSYIAIVVLAALLAWYVHPVMAEEVSEPALSPPPSVEAAPSPNIPSEEVGGSESNAVSAEPEISELVSGPADTPPPENLPPPEIESNVEEVIPEAVPPEEGTANIVQDAVSSQETISAGELVNTVDPAEAVRPDSQSPASTSPTNEPFTLESAPEVNLTSTTTESGIPLELSVPDIVATIGDEGGQGGDALVESEAVPKAAEPAGPESLEPEPPRPEVVASIEAKELKPKPEYTFALGGERVSTRKKPKWQAGQQATSTDVAAISEAPAIAADNEVGVLSVSGSCAKKYFVILLYREKEDYDLNPGSYILNRAFECLDGSYSYAVKDLPKDLEPGTYYLLVGEQGYSGPWSPSSALVPIAIQPTQP